MTLQPLGISRYGWDTVINLTKYEVYNSSVSEQMTGCLTYFFS